MKHIHMMQNAESGRATIACRLVTDDNTQVTLIPGQWVKIAECAPGNHVMRVGVILAEGSIDISFSLLGAIHNGSETISDSFLSPVDGARYEIEVLP